MDLGISKWPEELQGVDWHKLEYDWKLHAPIPYSPKNLDKRNDQSVGPFDEQDIDSQFWRHWLGTNELGIDVMSAMIHGTRISLAVGVISMSIAALIGILLGALAGYFGDDRLRVSRIRLALLIIGFFFACFLWHWCKIIRVG